MQVSYQTQPSAVKPTLGTLSPSTLPPGSTLSAVSQKLYNQDLITGKGENENYNLKRIYSPFLSPSNVIISDRVDASKGLNPKFFHNEARTRYFFVSKPLSANDHLKVNLFA